MKNAIEIRNLTKKYKDFTLDNACFDVPSGYICGFIGQNGAGKTTILKIMLGITQKDSGDITVLGKPETDHTVRENIGVLFEHPHFQDEWNAIDVEKAKRPFFLKWDNEAYYRYLHKFSLNPKQKFRKMSRGMKMKLGLAATFSQNADLLILDEPTVGLDPVAREEVLDIMRDYMTRENKTIFFSTHITGDLEKIADYIVYIDNGQILFSGMKDELIEKYCLIRGGSEDLPPAKRKSIIGYREHIGGFEGMIAIDDLGGFPSTIVSETVTLEDIMVHMANRSVGKEI